MKKIMFLTMLAVLLALPAASYTESTQENGLVASSGNPVFLASYKCGDGECKDGWSCCGSYHACCPPGLNVFCPSSRKCYSNSSDAAADCGDKWTICASPAAENKQEFIVEPVSAKLNNEKTETTKIILASDAKIPCYVRGQLAAYCPYSLPYYHTFSDTCHATLEGCKKMDGDMADLPGLGGCVVCSFHK